MQIGAGVCNQGSSPTRAGHKKGLKTEVLKPLMSELSRAAEPEILQRHHCR
jgi:hypothetical protein